MSLDRARAAVSWSAVVGVVALLVVAVTVFAVRVGAARAAAQPRPVEVVGTTQLTRTAQPFGVPTAGSGAASVSTIPATPLPSGKGSPAPAPTVGLTAGGVVVDIAGLVVRPGVRTLATGARVNDALAAAGGVRPGADLTRLNLARLLVDGEQLYVPAPGQEPPRLLLQGASGAAAAGGAMAGGGTGVAGGPTGGPRPGVPVDLNLADLSALDGLPGVGPVLAQRILDWRSAHGRFTSVDELGEVSGIGDKVLATLRPLVTL